MAGLDPAISAPVAPVGAVAQNSQMAGGWVYMTTNRRNGVLYVGVTSNMPKRAGEVVPGFTSRYRLKRLVWVERHATMPLAIQREKNIKHWPRRWKVELITATNPHWHDLYEQVL